MIPFNLQESNCVSATLSTAESVEKANASTSSVGRSCSMHSEAPKSLDSSVLPGSPHVCPVSSRPGEDPHLVDQPPQTDLAAADPLLAAETAVLSPPDQAAGQESAPQQAAKENRQLFQELMGLSTASGIAGADLPAARNSGVAAPGRPGADAAASSAEAAAGVVPAGESAVSGNHLPQQPPVQATWQPTQPPHQPLAHAVTGLFLLMRSMSASPSMKTHIHPCDSLMVPVQLCTKSTPDQLSARCS